MPDEDLTIHTPGDGPGDSGSADTSTDSPELSALKTENATLRAALDDALGKLHDLETVPSASPRVAEVRRIGEDWSRMTAAQAQAAGCKDRVLCSDGYFIPG
jgi:hypothetical protein